MELNTFLVPLTTDPDRISLTARSDHKKAAFLTAHFQRSKY